MPEPVGSSVELSWTNPIYYNSLWVYIHHPDDLIVPVVPVLELQMNPSEVTITGLTPGDYVVILGADCGFGFPTDHSAPVPFTIGSAAFCRGDTNVDGILDLADCVKTLDSLFNGQGELPCKAAGDVNEDGVLNLADPIMALQFLFAGGPAPGAPFPTCGEDPNPQLSCLQSMVCP